VTSTAFTSFVIPAVSVADAGVALASGVATAATVAVGEGLGVGVAAAGLDVAGGVVDWAEVPPPPPHPVNVTAPIRAAPTRPARMCDLLVAPKAERNIPRTAVIGATRWS
jgi:hypothetical protein